VSGATPDHFPTGDPIVGTQSQPRGEVVLVRPTRHVEPDFTDERQDPACRQAIRDTSSPGMAKRLAAPPQAPRRVSAQSWFRKNGTLLRPGWHDVKLDIMRRLTWRCEDS
jgi:hypothetical protein